MLDHVLAGHLRMARASMGKALLRVPRGSRFRSLAEADLLVELERHWQPVDPVLTALVETEFPGTCVSCQSCEATTVSQDGPLSFDMNGLCPRCAASNGRRRRICQDCGVTSTDVRFRTFDTVARWLCSRCAP